MAHVVPPCFLAESRKRRLNRGSFVSAVCLVVFFDLYCVYVCIFVIYIEFLPYGLFVSNSQVIRCEDRLQNDLYHVGWGIKLCSIQSKSFQRDPHIHCGRKERRELCVCVCLCPGAYPGYGVLPPELARDAAAAAAAAAAASMSHLAGLGSLSPGGLAYARAAMVCLHLTCAHILLVVTSNYIFLQKKCISPTQFQFVILLFCGYQPKAVEQPSSWS